MFFCFNDTATTEIYTLSLHDALPISCTTPTRGVTAPPRRTRCARFSRADRKSTRLNSSHGSMSYAVVCLKKKNICGGGGGMRKGEGIGRGGDGCVGLG